MGAFFTVSCGAIVAVDINSPILGLLRDLAFLKAHINFTAPCAGIQGPIGPLHSLMCWSADRCKD